MAVRPCGTVCRCAREILIVPKRRRRVRDICDAGARRHQRTPRGRCHDDRGDDDINEDSDTDADADAVGAGAAGADGTWNSQG